MAGGGDVSWRRAFTEHLLDGVAWDEVNQEKDQAHYQPDDWERVEDALEDGLQGRSLVVSRRLSVVRCQFSSASEPGAAYKQLVNIAVTTGSDTTVPSEFTPTRIPISAASSPQAKFSHSAEPLK